MGSSYKSTSTLSVIFVQRRFNSPNPSLYQFNHSEYFGIDNFIVATSSRPVAYAYLTALWDPS